MFPDGRHHNLVWAVVKSKTEVVTLFAFLETACYGVPDLGSLCDEPQLTTQPNGVLLALSPAVRDAILEIGVFAFLRESEYDAVLGLVSFPRR